MRLLWKVTSIASKSAGFLKEIIILLRLVISSLSSSAWKLQLQVSQRFFGEQISKSKNQMKKALMLWKKEKGMGEIAKELRIPPSSASYAVKSGQSKVKQAIETIKWAKKKNIIV